MTTEERTISVIEQYRIIRSHIEHEDNLVSQRLNWLLASQSFLFTAYAITLNGPMQSRFKIFETHSELLILLITIVGTISAVLIWTSVLAGYAAMRNLRNRYRQSVGEHLPPELPPIQTQGMTLRAGQLSPVLTPLLFISVWLVLLVSR